MAKEKRVLKVGGINLKARITLIKVFHHQINGFIKRYTLVYKFSTSKETIKFPQVDNWLISYTKETVLCTLQSIGI